MEQHIRRLRLSHVANVRDLGGYEADGGVIRWNRLYRAGDLSGADAGDWERLKAAGVRTILDLRSASELRAKPDRPPQGISWYHLPLQTEEIDLEHPADLAGLAFLKSLRESYVIMAGENTGLLAAALARLTASRLNAKCVPVPTADLTMRSTSTLPVTTRLEMRASATQSR